MRDVFEEMSLNGVRPSARSYYIGLFSAMKSRKLGDAMFFWEEMQRHGIQPDVRACQPFSSSKILPCPCAPPPSQPYV
jgi:pentatricopeptide repeat protein